ncbi:MAG TPA: biotin--[acetyl-CoA-carboxylase] ligase [Flavobacteriales bacterium]|nr:biotin--[acetyl-CoA-carboxylase] ligase [Flavobacteriales bacterium]
MPFGHPLLEYDELASTNAEAAALVSAGEAVHSTVVLAHAQSQGQGQRGRVWHSQPGLDLTFSVVCKPAALRADRQFCLSKVAALAVFDAVRPHVQADVRIKWPNDVLVAGKKVAGILIQNELSGDRVATSIIGIGLNVNSTGFPDELVATSLLRECGQELDRRAVLLAFLERFGHWWQKWEQAPDEGLVSYTDRLWTRGRWAPMLLDDAPITARALDVDELGRLLIETEDGSVSAYGLDRLRFAPRTPGLHG